MTPSFEKVFFEDNFLHIHWKNKEKSKYGYYFLRVQCPCASCVDELSGERILNEKYIPKNITPLKSNFVGNYALQIHWSDGHKTGIYTWNFFYRSR